MIPCTIRLKHLCGSHHSVQASAGFLFLQSSSTLLLAEFRILRKHASDDQEVFFRTSFGFRLYVSSIVGPMRSQPRIPKPEVLTFV